MEAARYELGFSNVGTICRSSGLARTFASPHRPIKSSSAGRKVAERLAPPLSGGSELSHERIRDRSVAGEAKVLDLGSRG